MKNLLPIVVAFCSLTGIAIYADEPVLSSAKAIGYAYMKDGNHLLKVSNIYSTPEKDVEVIKITDAGYYPMYSMDNKEVNGEIPKDCGSDGSLPEGSLNSKGTENGKLFCNSHYIERKALVSLTRGVLTAGVAFFSFGTSLAAGYADLKFFNKEQFLKDVNNSNLEKYRISILSLNSYASNKENEINALYDRAFLDYSNNQKLITISYTVQDKSGLYNQTSVDGGYSVRLNAPEKKSYGYISLLRVIFTKLDSEVFGEDNENIDAHVELIKKKIDEKYNKDVLEYNKYLTENFKNYNIVGQSPRIFQINNNVSFYGTIKAPYEEVPYIFGKKITIDIPVIMEYANLKGMVPKEYDLKDTNFNMLIRTTAGVNTNGIMTNKTQSFITVKSLTSYYQNLVFNISNIDKELAPEAGDLNNGTYYPLITSAMNDKSNFEKITKSKAQSIKINYGYAIKYKLNETNIEKAIYNTKNYSLYTIIQQYM